MSWRARIIDDPFRDGVRLALYRHHPADPDHDAEVVIALDPAQPRGMTTELVPAGANGPMPDQLPGLPDELGRALLDALAAHYGGTSNSRQARADYDAERGRVDRLIGALIDTTRRDHS